MLASIALLLLYVCAWFAYYSVKNLDDRISVLENRVVNLEKMLDDHVIQIHEVSIMPGKRIGTSSVQRIKDHLIKRGINGATAAEVYASCGIPRNSACTSLNALVRNGDAVKTSVRRICGSGTRSAVYVAAAFKDMWQGRIKEIENG